MIRFLQLLTAIAVLCFALPVNGQLHLGLQGGLNIATFSGEEIDGASIDFSNRTVFGVGGVLDVTLNEKVTLRFEPSYLQKGAEFLEPDSGGDITLNFKQVYLELPALIKFALGNSATRPYLIAGPSLGLNLSSDIEAVTPIITADADAKDITKSIDFGVTFGAGVSLPAGANSVFIEGRYVLGLADIVKEGNVTFLGETETFEDAKINTRGIQIVAGIAFPIGSQ